VLRNHAFLSLLDKVNPFTIPRSNRQLDEKPEHPSYLRVSAAAMQLLKTPYSSLLFSQEVRTKDELRTKDEVGTKDELRTKDELVEWLVDLFGSAAHSGSGKGSQTSCGGQ
jgi:hypothetical protein